MTDPVSTVTAARIISARLDKPVEPRSVRFWVDRGLLPGRKAKTLRGTMYQIERADAEAFVPPGRWPRKAEDNP